VNKKMVRAFRRFVPIVLLMVVGTLALAACGGSSAAPASGSSGNAVTVNITLTDFKIDSSLTTFSVGVPYHFVVVNKGALSHQMLIMPPEPASMSAQQATQVSLAGIGGQGMAPGTTRTFDYTFTKAAPAGTLEFACHLPGHYEAGMHAPIVVK
jgi:uncharacterized cupredoxin-like copper-binding protein